MHNYNYVFPMKTDKRSHTKQGKPWAYKHKINTTNYQFGFSKYDTLF